MYVHNSVRATQQVLISGGGLHVPLAAPIRFDPPLPPALSLPLPLSHTCLSFCLSLSLTHTRASFVRNAPLGTKWCLF